MPGLPRHLLQRLWPKRLSIAIRRSFVQFEYDPGRPWYLIQSAADDHENHPQEDIRKEALNAIYPWREKILDKLVGRLPGHRPDQAIPLA